MIDTFNDVIYPTMNGWAVPIMGAYGVFTQSDILAR
jgi:hypothetical protein